MKKTKIILSLGVLFGIIFAGIVNAASSYLYVLPGTATKNVGESITTTIGISASGNKVCVVEGTVAFNNLSCQSITVADGLMAQSSPTCTNPHFIIGIPSCATVNTVLLSITSKTLKAGTATITVSNVDVIGEGVSVGNSSGTASYTVKTIATTPKTTPTTTPKTTPATTPKTTPTTTPKTTTQTQQPAETPTTEEEEIASQAPQVEDNSKQETVETTQAAVPASTATSNSTAQFIFWIIAILVIAVVIYFLQKRSKNKSE